VAEYKVIVTIVFPFSQSGGVIFQCSLFFRHAPIAMDSPYLFQSHEFRGIELSYLFGKDVVFRCHISTPDFVPNDEFRICIRISSFAGAVFHDIVARHLSVCVSHFDCLVWCQGERFCWPSAL